MFLFSRKLKYTIKLHLLILTLLLTTLKLTEASEYYIVRYGRYFVNYKKLSNKDSSITGTGNLLKDTVYRAKCISLNCEYCCEGSLNEMICGSYSDCLILKRIAFHDEILKILIIVIAFYSLIPVGWVFLYCLGIKKSKFYYIFNKIYVVYTSLLIPPYGIVKIYDCLFKKNYKENGGTDIQPINNKTLVTMELFHLKTFKAKDYQNGLAKINENYIGNEFEIVDELENDINLNIQS